MQSNFDGSRVQEVRERQLLQNSAQECVLAIGRVVELSGSRGRAVGLVSMVISFPQRNVFCSANGSHNPASASWGGMVSSGAAFMPLDRQPPISWKWSGLLLATLRHNHLDALSCVLQVS